jgi:hypothetical protein
MLAAKLILVFVLLPRYPPRHLQLIRDKSEARSERARVATRARVGQVSDGVDMAPQDAPRHDHSRKRSSHRDG